MRQVVLDTETTGLEPEAGHRIIEIGCVELVNRRVTQNSFHRYVNPQRAIDEAAREVHGIEDEDLVSQPLFVEIANEFLEFVDGAQLVIHNADFDVSFINHEFARSDDLPSDLRAHCDILDTLALARRQHPGQRNNLNALAKRYHVDISKRELHGALLDAQILADVYLAMTGGQASLSLDGQAEEAASHELAFVPIQREGLDLTVPRASAEEEEAHGEILDRIQDQTGTPSLWDVLDNPSRSPRE